MNDQTQETSLENKNTEYIPTYPDLESKVALVTGSSRGIGAATCQFLAANDVRIVVNGRDEAAVENAVENIRYEGGQAIGIAADCTNFDAIERMREQVEDELGPIDVLCAFVGSGGPPPGPMAQITEEGWQAALEGNLNSTFLTMKSFMPGMIERENGVIITMSSTAARSTAGDPTGAPTAYATAKAGVVQLTREAAKEVAEHNVRVNCISPSTILTERTRSHIPEDRKQKMAAMHPLGRLGVPADVAHAALFLASESASWITGITLDVAGGQIMA